MTRGKITDVVFLKKLDRRNKKHRVFTLLRKEVQDTFLAYWNKGWYCAGAIFHKWPSTPEDPDCPNCCVFCREKNSCQEFKCQDFSPLKSMTNCSQWIASYELLLVDMNLLTSNGVTRQRAREYFDLFEGFHIEEEEWLSGEERKRYLKELE